MIGNLIALPIALAAAYLTGSIPTSYIFARALKGIDIRQHGSGNVGATNVVRTVGKVPGLIVLVLDIVKGVLAVTFMTVFFYKWLNDFDFVLFRSMMGIAVICGHVWTVFLGFKGGKGIATTLGVTAIISPAALAAASVVWLASFIITSYVSLSSILLVVACPIVSAIIGEPVSVVVFTILVCLITTYRHKSNITRLLNGTESKIKLFSRSVKV